MNVEMFLLLLLEEMRSDWRVESEGTREGPGDSAGSGRAELQHNFVSGTGGQFLSLKVGDGQLSA